MDTLKKYGIKKSKAILLFVQMILTIILLITSVYLLIFVISNKLGGWMISSYVLIILTVLTIIEYGIYGYKKDDVIYRLSIVPFLLAIFVNILMPNRTIIQEALLILLLLAVFAFLIMQSNSKYCSIASYEMIVLSLVFSVYSSITADTQFLGELSASWITYLAMYLSIFVPTITSTTLALTYSVRRSRKKVNEK